MSAPAILRTESLDGGGVTKEVYAEGAGDFPCYGANVTAHYTGRLLDGTVFDSSVERGQTFKFQLGLGRVIKGWDSGFASMRKGEKAFLTCTPDFAYGAAGSPPKIPAGATLRFEVELIDWARDPQYMSLPEKVKEAEAAKEAGNRAFTKGDLGDALAEYARAWGVVEWETDASATALRASIKNNAAQVRLKQGDWAGALKDAGKAAEVDPANAKAFFRKGAAAGKLGEWDAAVAALRECVRLAPGDPAARDALAAAKTAATEARKSKDSMWGGMFKKAAGGMYADVPAPPAHAVREDDLDAEDDAAVERAEEEEAAEEAAAAAGGGGGGGGGAPDEALDGEAKAEEGKADA
jgi:peptidylprolyl isomerase